MSYSKYVSLLAGLWTSLSLVAQTAGKEAHIIVNNQVVRVLPAATIDSVVTVKDLGIKVYVHGQPSLDVLDGSIRYVDPTQPTPNPPGESGNANRNTDFNGMRQWAWRLEYPKMRNTPENVISVQQTDQYGVTFSLEYDTKLKATRWVCYQFHSGIPYNKTHRKDNWHDDPNIAKEFCIHHKDYAGLYSRENYDRGHLCASDDRWANEEANDQTFCTSNCLPQNAAHNRGIWKRMEEQVRKWGSDRSFCDTLYVVKAATIDQTPAPNGGVYGYTTPTKGKQQAILVPRYFYMALLAVKIENGKKKYKALGFWTEQHHDFSSAQLQDQVISVEQLQKYTGIDFFCNLPDGEEKAVEATYRLDDWAW